MDLHQRPAFRDTLPWTFGMDHMVVGSLVGSPLKAFFQGHFTLDILNGSFGRWFLGWTLKHILAKCDLATYTLMIK